MEDEEDTLESLDRQLGLRPSRRGRRKEPLRDRVKRAESRRRTGKRWKSKPKHTGEASDFALEDVHVMNPTKDPNDVLFGVYGLDDWVTSTHMKRLMIAGKSSIAIEGTWVTDAAFKISEWVPALGAERFNFMSASRALVHTSWGLLEVVASRGKLEIEANGEPEKVREFMAGMDTKFKRAENLIEWVYGSRGQSISVPLNYRPAVPGSYPWLPMPLEQYIDAYLNSSASVLILIGPPGTGKTTFIKNLIHHSGGDAKITYDEKIMSEDSLFAQFIEGEEKFMIMEDADAFLKARTEGNTMMHRFLNVADGLISAEGKKLVFSTNLPGVKDIDPALMRAGRCFDVVKFRALSRDEATVVAEHVGSTLPDGNQITLAQLFNTKPSGELQERVGFT